MKEILKIMNLTDMEFFNARLINMKEIFQKVKKVEKVN
jgi:hypothetical protein